MARFPVQTIESAPDGAKTALRELQATFGLIPNIAGVIANSPVLADIFVRLFQGVHGGSLTEAEIQTLLLTNAVTNRCAWAVAFHSLLALQQGLEPADVQAIREGATPQAPRLAALSAYARALIETRGQPGDAALDALEAAGFGRDQALEVLAVSAASTITNYAGNLALPPLEPMLRDQAWKGASR